MIEKLDIPAIERLLEDEIQNANNYIYGSDYVAAERERNLDYYNGIMGDLPSPKGRSKQITPVMKTYIDMMIPSLMRIFFSGRDYAVFSSTDKAINEACRGITRYINDTVFKKDNRGVLIGRGGIKDALLCKAGILKAWWSQSKKTEDQTFDGLDDNQFTMLMSQAQAQGLEPVAYSGPFANDGPMHSVVLRKTIDTSKVEIAGVPPEEWIISRDARNYEDAVLKAHRYPEKVGKLLERGYDLAIIDELTDYTDPTRSRYGTSINQPNQRTRNGVEDKMLREVTVFEGIILCNADGQGLKEYFFVAGGSTSKIRMLEIEPYNCQVVFADLQGDHDPHSFWAKCTGDDLAQWQRVCTVLIRMMLDNIYLSNTPQREVVADWIIKPDQLMNFAPGAPILVKQPGAIREISVPFTAANSLELLNYFDQRAQESTGANKQSAGLDPETLSNQTATASQLAYQASMGRLEDVARNLRVGFEKLFRGLFKIVTTYQSADKVISIDGQPQQINPQAWATLGDLDITINTGLGAGNRDRDASFLYQNLQLQSQFIREVGPNAAINFNTLMDSYELWLESLGVENPRQISGKLPQNWVPQPQQPQPSPDTVVNAQTAERIETLKLQQKQAEALAQIQSDERIALAEIESKERIAAGQNLIAQDANAINAARTALEADVKNKQIEKAA